MILYLKTILLISLLFFIASAQSFFSGSGTENNRSWDFSSTKNIPTKEDSLLLDNGKAISFSPSAKKLKNKKSDSVGDYNSKLKMRISTVSHKFYKKPHIKRIKSSLAEINRKYGAYIKQASQLTNVPENLIASFIYIESNGIARSLNKKSGATGLMQLTQGAASDIIFLKYKQKRLSKAERAIITKTIGNRLDCILSMRHMGQKRQCNGNIGYNVFTEDLYNPEFNILCGAIFLGILIDAHTENGIVRLDKVVAKYNIGLFTKIKGDTTEEIMQHTNKETRAYIKKLTGTNGILDIMAI